MCSLLCLQETSLKGSCSPLNKKVLNCLFGRGNKGKEGFWGWFGFSKAFKVNAGCEVSGINITEPGIAVI